MVASTTESVDHGLYAEKVENDSSIRRNDSVAENPNCSSSEDDDIVYPGVVALSLTMFALCISIFLVALDQTIIAPALGAITAQFQSTKDIVSRNICHLHVLLQNR
jgi:hypothetical protein